MGMFNIGDVLVQEIIDIARGNFDERCNLVSKFEPDYQ